MNDNHLDTPNVPPSRKDRKIKWPVLSVRLDPETYKELKARARADRKKPGPWARDFITEALGEAA